MTLRLLRLPKQWGPGPQDCVPCRLPLPLLGRRGGDGEEVHRCLKAWARPVGGLGKDSGALQDTPPACSLGPRSSPASPRPGELEGPGEKAGICHLPHSPPDDHQYADAWLKNAPLTIAH